ncbi:MULTISPECIES: DUF4010 domain-containing protein [Pseudomonas]|uniref:MgtC/SapB family protein n=1 Tax=Pseudomonas TaxID=286 RepID=UPI000CD4EE79|nr:MULTISPECIES: DUF4010 domain-containing protein [Pseudomonas]MPQ65670.1 DUF4010 domain-containing protein [Pseudomonas sp. MWU12-2323]RBH55229.1 DUF4010 domain-containing protein [Pseudomonas sp. MWU13-2860]
METITHATNLASALGLGLLVGFERERKKGEGANRHFAGLRTFALTSLLGYVGLLLGGPMLLSTLTVALAMLAGVAYFKRRSQNPGMTTGVALLLVLLLGALCNSEAVLAVALAVILTVLLNFRQSLHRFALNQLSETEVKDGLILATAALVIMPLVPDAFIGPYQAINPRSICLLTVLIMGVSALGHIAIRVLGVRNGLSLAGFASGFVSSVATIAAMGNRARQQPGLLPQAASAAILSNLATLILLGLVLGAISPATLVQLSLPLMLGSAVAASYALRLMKRPPADTSPPINIGHAFNLKLTLMVAAGISSLFLVTSAMQARFGLSGLFTASILGGLADAHATSASVAALVKSGQLSAENARLPILAILASNTLSKCVMAWSSGGGAFARRVVPALLLILLALAAGAFIQGRLIPG